MRKKPAERRLVDHLRIAETARQELPLWCRASPEYRRLAALLVEARQIAADWHASIVYAAMPPPPPRK